MKADYAFPVELMPIQTTKGGIAVPDRAAVIRTDTQETLGIVSTKYQLFKHSDVVSGFRKVLAGMDSTETIQLMKNGAHLFAKYRLNGVQMEVSKGDVVALQFVVKNSYDGSNTLQVSLGAFRLVCSNGMVIGKRMSSYSQKHVGAMEFNVQEFRDRVDVMKKQFEEVIPFMQQMSRTPMAADPEYFSKEVVPFPDYLLSEAEKEYNTAGDKTVWGWYNSLTSAVTHNMKHENPHTSIHLGKVAWQAAQRML